MTDEITPERVQEILAMSEQPVRRNLLITHAYHRLTLQMAALLGDEHWSWPVFATWASKQAGVFIRQEELPAALRQLLARPEQAPRWLPPELARLRGPDRPLLDTADAIVDGITRFIVAGNVIVFEELGHAFAGFHALFRDPGARTEQQLTRLLEQFTEGPSLPDSVTISADGTLLRSHHGGQSLIREAMRHYFEALTEHDTNARAELILLANVQCGLHEQIRLQPYIAGSLNTPSEALLRLANGGELEHPLRDPIAVLARRLSTELLMTLEMPDQTLRPGADLPAAPDQPMWPPALRHLEHPTLLELARQVGAYETREQGLDLRDRVEGWINLLLAQLELVEEQAQGSGADDWASLSDRMRYIFEYFRSRQSTRALMTSPFSPAQIAQLEAGRVPDGPL